MLLRLRHLRRAKLQSMLAPRQDPDNSCSNRGHHQLLPP